MISLLLCQISHRLDCGDPRLRANPYPAEESCNDVSAPWLCRQPHQRTSVQKARRVLPVNPRPTNHTGGNTPTRRPFLLYGASQVHTREATWLAVRCSAPKST